MLLEIVAQAALDAGRDLRVLERRTQAQEHSEGGVKVLHARQVGEPL
jgi:hypothetical protein